jgi:uncharacterized protein (DUF1810 family)
MSSLNRFVEAQRPIYDDVLDELRAGRKQSHWMWFIFPQIAGLGRSETARFYAIESLAEARVYLAHDLLGPRLAECTGAMLAWIGRRGATEILGTIDALKFRSSMTLFEAAGGGECFAAAIGGFFDDRRDEQTLALLADSR